MQATVCLKALMVLYLLHQAQRSPARMMSWNALQQQIKLNSEELAHIVECLQARGWVGKIQRTDGGYSLGLDRRWRTGTAGRCVRRLCVRYAVFC